MNYKFPSPEPACAPRDALPDLPLDLPKSGSKLRALQTLRDLPPIAKRLECVRLAGALVALLPLHCVAALWLLFTGCISNPSHPPAGGLDLPERWIAAPTPEGAVLDEWWKSFGDPDLVQTIETALVRNYDLQAAGARLDIAAAEARIAGADLWPRLDLGFNATREQRNFVGLPVPGGERVLTSRATSFGVDLNSTWEVDLWGRIRSGKRAAAAEFQGSEADFAGARHSLAGQTAKAWLAVVESRRQLELAEETVQSFRLTADQVRSRYERGLRPSLDVRLALSTLANAEAVREERRLRVERAVRQLEILLGRYPSGQLHAAAKLPGVPPPVPAGLPADLLERRPDLAAAEQRLAATDARIAQAKAARLPRVALTASGGTASNELADLISTDFTVWTLAGNLAQPILQGGRLKAGVAQAEARSRQALAQYQTALLRAFEEVESALVAEQILRHREQELANAAREAAAAFKLAQERYGAGLENFATVLEAQRQSVEAEIQLAAIRRQRLENRVDLHLALGGGFQVIREDSDVERVGNISR